MSLAMPNTLDRFLNILPIFHWNMAPTSATLNSGLVNLYMPNYYANMVRHEDVLSDFSLCHPKLAPISVRYFTFVIFENISLVGLLCTGLISAWLHLSGSKQRWMVPFSFEIITKLLHH